MFKVGKRKQTPRHGRSFVHSDFFPCFFMASSSAVRQTSFPSEGTVIKIKKVKLINNNNYINIMLKNRIVEIVYHFF